ncbi:histone-lysine N-methyltransferase SETMAR-like [Halyomorpha halys]|uniref:histone-lysine N-methyltransferase SETMAR-like n=1 Tax=Halyomorpha halys TaxID=286706 RepID=UPI0006D4DB78|nr:uncharacterized protein LOC106691305 [Halyomorpha halys]
MSYEILIILRHYWTQNFTAADATCQIIKYEGEGVLYQCTVRHWIEKFSSGDMIFERKKGSGRPLMNIGEVLQEAVEPNPFTSTSELARECGVSKDIVSYHLLSMGKVKKSSRDPSRTSQQSAMTSVKPKKSLKDFMGSNSCHIHHKCQTSHHQITTCFDPWPISFKRKI